MAPRDQPPHFGAWCQGNSGNTLTYVSFLPNIMHNTANIALNVSIWAFHRAHWADAYLAQSACMFDYGAKDAGKPMSMA
jgi:hypothetical protein